MANPARAYLTTQVETTSQGELLIMLYEAAIKFLKRAKIEIENKDYAKKGIYISKAMAIIHELVESLNKEKGGDITPKLLSLYQFCISQLIRANIRLDTKRIDDVIQILDGIRSAYAQIVAQEEGKPMPANGQAASQATAQQKAPAPPTTPPAPPILDTAGQPGSYAAHKPAPQGQAPATPTPPSASAPQPKQKAQPAQQEQEPATDKTPPAQPAAKEQQSPPKLRSAFNAAKFRAANAYNNNT